MINNSLISPIGLPEERAAITLQSAFRTYLAHRMLLPIKETPLYRDLCKRIEEKEIFPRAQCGRTPVYLPLEAPQVALKHSGRAPAIKRFHQMQEVKAVLCEKKITHLTIPKARLSGDFLIEERLPINTDSYDNMELYLFNLSLFDQAVREMTRLFSSLHIGDLVNIQKHPLSHLKGVEDTIRYDNLPLYIANGVGKIGLIDLVRTTLSPDPKDIPLLARIFPYHAGLIKEEAKALNISYNEEQFTLFEERGKKFFSEGFKNHLKWIFEKKSPFPSPFSITKKRQEALTALILKSSYVKINPELASTLCYSILKGLKEALDKKQHQSMKRVSQEAPTSSDLVRVYSPLIKRSSLYEKARLHLYTDPDLDLSNDKATTLAKRLASTVMRALVEGGELFYFDPCWSSEKDLCWVRY